MARGAGRVEDRQLHWQAVYSAKAPSETSWHQDRARLSLELIVRTGLAKGAAIIDVGGGASRLVDDLLGAGHFDITVLDISQRALDAARSRLGAQASRVHWIVADVTRWKPERQFNLWHDRAVLHFLTDPKDQEAYGAALRAALAPGGHAIIAGFAPGGPEKCSGLAVVQHDSQSVRRIVGGGFELVAEEAETHLTPQGARQAFHYFLFRRALPPAA
jgi:SAM-dependent methyltransferase